MVYADYIVVQLPDLIVAELIMIDYGLTCYLEVQVDVELFEIVVNVPWGPGLEAVSSEQDQVTRVLLLLGGITPVNKAVFTLRRSDDLMGANCTVGGSSYPNVISQLNVVCRQVQQTYQTADRKYDALVVATNQVNRGRCPDGCINPWGQKDPRAMCMKSEKPQQIRQQLLVNHRKAWKCLRQD
jgi:hypothetical protein